VEGAQIAHPPPRLPLFALPELSGITFIIVPAAEVAADLIGIALA
jgi:hypothetical protein